MKYFLTGFKMIKGIQNKRISVKNLCTCNNTALINTEHIGDCEQHAALREEVYKLLKENYSTIKREIEKHHIDQDSASFNCRVRKLETIIKKHVFGPKEQEEKKEKDDQGR